MKLKYLIIIPSKFKSNHFFYQNHEIHLFIFNLLSIFGFPQHLLNPIEENFLFGQRCRNTVISSVFNNEQCSSIPDRLIYISTKK